MQMINLLAGGVAIVDMEAISRFDAREFGDGFRRQEQLAQLSSITKRTQILKMLFRHYQDMHGRFRVDIVKGHGKVIFPDQLGFVPVGNTAENTIIHGSNNSENSEVPPPQTRMPGVAGLRIPVGEVSRRA